MLQSYCACAYAHHPCVYTQIPFSPNPDFSNLTTTKKKKKCTKLAWTLLLTGAITSGPPSAASLGGFFFILFRPNYNKSPSSSVHDANDPTLPRKQNLVLDKALEIKAVFMVVSEIILAESSPSSSWSADWASWQTIYIVALPRDDIGAFDSLGYVCPWR
jgi:hypothetical protein